MKKPLKSLRGAPLVVELRRQLAAARKRSRTLQRTIDGINLRNWGRADEVARISRSSETEIRALKAQLKQLSGELNIERALRLWTGSVVDDVTGETFADPYAWAVHLTLRGVRLVAPEQAPSPPKAKEPAMLGGLFSLDGKLSGNSLDGTRLWDNS